MQKYKIKKALVISQNDKIFFYLIPYYLTDIFLIYA